MDGNTSSCGVGKLDTNREIRERTAGGPFYGGKEKTSGKVLLHQERQSSRKDRVQVKMDNPHAGKGITSENTGLVKKDGGTTAVCVRRQIQ